MIPLMALILKVLFLRHKGYNFVDHTIFSLHIQSFFFSILILLLLNPLSYIENDVINDIETWKNLGLLLAGIIYLIAALHNTYKTKWPKAVFYSFFVMVGYVITFALVFLCYSFIIARMAKYMG